MAVSSGPREVDTGEFTHYLVNGLRNQQMSSYTHAYTHTLRVKGGRDIHTFHTGL